VRVDAAAGVPGRHMVKSAITGVAISSVRSCIQA